MSPGGRLAGGLHWLVPCVLIAAYAAPLVGYQLPNNFDELDESFEPIKTLKFVHARGDVVHKWGPMPNLLYAPVYAPFLGYWKLTGDLARPSTDYPYGFARPFEQQGALILAARLFGLGAGLLATLAYGRSLARWTGSRGAVLVALVALVATGADVPYKFVATKPDGLMIAFLMGSMAAYAAIIADGLTPRRGAWLSLTAVASVSCKEQTLPAYAAIYLGVLLAGRHGLPRGRFLGRFAATIGVGLLAYLLVNVVYAPSAWLAHVREWVGGPGKDPAVWARPGYTPAAYLGDTRDALLYNLGPGGAAIALAALGLGLARRPPWLVAAWLPAAGYLVLMILSAGYMPHYFLLPMNVLLVLPVALAFAPVARSWPNWPLAARAAAGSGLAAALALNLWAGNMAWAQVGQLNATMIERYCIGHLGRDETVHLANLWVRQPGAHRLAYLGYKVDDRPLGELFDRPADRPDVVLMTREQENWLNDFRLRPRRNAMMAATGFSYDRFGGMDALGYRAADVVRPALPGFLRPPWFPWSWYRVGPHRELVVYRRDDGAGAAP